MKLYKYIVPIAMLFALAACEKDNYHAPSSQLTGNITYQGKPLNFSNGDLSFEMWDTGWGKSAPISVNVAPEGSYSGLLFDESYKLIIPKYRGPFLNLINDKTHSDTIPVNVNGSMKLDIEVLPYYMLKNVSISIGADSIVTASFGLDTIVKDANKKNIEFVALYLNKTQLIRDGVSVNTKTSGGSIANINNIKLTRKVEFVQEYDAATAKQNYVYAAVGVKIEGINTLLCSPVQKIDIH